MGVSKEDRDFLGRWALGKHGSNDYVLTSQQIVTGIQKQLARGILEGGHEYKEVSLLQSLKSFLQNRGTFYEHSWFKLESLIKTTSGFHLVCSYPAHKLTEAPCSWETLPEAPPVDRPPMIESAEQSTAKFWVSIQRRSGFKRLHKSDCASCMASRWKCHNTEDVHVLNSTVAHARCRICFPKLSTVLTQHDESSSSSSGSSSSSLNELALEAQSSLGDFNALGDIADDTIVLVDE